MTHECIWSQARGITLETRGCAGESGFDHVELWVMGPPGGLKVGRRWRLTRSCKQGRSEDSLSVMSTATSIPRARDEENHFHARWMRRTNRQSSRPLVVTGMSSTKAIGSYWQNCTPRCLRKQENISTSIIYITRKVKPNNGKDYIIIRLDRSMERKTC